jgi:hypothetical protein
MVAVAVLEQAEHRLHCTIAANMGYPVDCSIMYQKLSPAWAPFSLTFGSDRLFMNEPVVTLCRAKAGKPEQWISMMPQIVHSLTEADLVLCRKKSELARRPVTNYRDRVRPRPFSQQRPHALSDDPRAVIVPRVMF